jgi:hypothetical protein
LANHRIAHISELSRNSELEYPGAQLVGEFAVSGECRAPDAVIGGKGSAKPLDGFEWEKWIALLGRV